MALVKVFRFNKYDINSDQRVVSRRMATREAIERLGATIMPDTETEIDDSHLNGDEMTEIDFTPP